MGTKVFINKTGRDLSIQLEVRKGDRPGRTLKYQSFSLTSGQSQRITYSGPDNPYLDGISVNTVADGSLIAEQQFVFNRGSELDNQFNTHDTVIFGWQNDSIVLSFANTWTVPHWNAELLPHGSWMDRSLDR
jgi:hypothetical protein